MASIRNVSSPRLLNAIRRLQSWIPSILLSSQTRLVSYTKEFSTGLSLHLHFAISLAVYFEQKDFTNSIKECEKAVEIGRENRADYKVVAKYVYTFVALSFADVS